MLAISGQEQEAAYRKESLRLIRVWWDDNVNVKKLRCGRCWLRRFECYCSVLDEKSRFYADGCNDCSMVKVLMYYHYKEIGRCPNTAHIFENIIPAHMFDKVIFGDVEKEEQLIQEMREEQSSERIQTCVLYPSKNAVLLSDWIANRPDKNLPIRLIGLDGTYSGAHRQFKFIQKAVLGKDEDDTSGDAIGHYPIVVKLDLENNRCVSAYAGLMHQPGTDKICTYQAIAMALQQTQLLPEKAFEKLLQDLKDWIQYLLEHRIKTGKGKPKYTEGINNETDVNDYVRDFLAAHPPPKTCEEARLRKIKRLKLANINFYWRKHMLYKFVEQIEIIRSRKFYVYEHRN